MRTISLLALLALVSLPAAELPFKSPAEYACTMAITGGTHPGKGKLYQGAKGVRRIDMESERGPVGVILRPDTKQMIMLMVTMKMYMTMPLNPAQMQVQDPTADPHADFTKTGSETIDGIACDRYEFTSKGDKGIAWIDAAKSVPVRVKGKGDTQVDFTDYQIGPQKAELFEAPKDYQPMGAGMPAGQ